MEIVEMAKQAKDDFMSGNIIRNARILANEPNAYGVWQILTEDWGEAATDLYDIVTGGVREIIEDSDIYQGAAEAFGVGRFSRPLAVTEALQRGQAARNRHWGRALPEESVPSYTPDPGGGAYGVPGSGVTIEPPLPRNPSSST